VWKGRRMPGRHAFKMRTIKKLQVYRIDYEKSLVFLKGSVMGSGIREVVVRDSFFHRFDNEDKLNFPTFVY
jgi:hypothetical protein